MKRRYYKVVDSTGTAIQSPKGGVMYFHRKDKAKKCRDLHKGTHVTHGPDHWKKNGGIFYDQHQEVAGAA